jgi:pectin methylesterase-like acyl-CoA thioesterase
MVRQLNLLLAAIVAIACDASASQIQAAEIAAVSCSQPDVQAAVDRAGDGDTVTVPAGSSTWNREVSILDKTITLVGAGSDAGGTRITYGWESHTLLSVNAGERTGKMDISRFWLSGGDTDYWSGCMQYQIGSQGHGPQAKGYPLYLWSNTANGKPAGMVVTAGANHVKQGRDFIDHGSTPKPGYKPYQYPHPLTLAGK